MEANTQTDKEILDQFGKQVVSDLINSLRQSKDRLDVFLINENNEAENSLSESATNTELLVEGNPFLIIAERGRGKTINPGDGALRRAVSRWIEVEGIVSTYTNKATGKPFSQVSLAYFISKSIHRGGTNLYKRGGNSGVLSEVVTPERIDALLETFGNKYFNEISSQILTAFE